ncbi:MAG TPA: hypothetical protein DIT05_15600 [Morganella sp. (in: Bacteria)]|nr:hypothetical protein [Morganella sp. (in: enterobacteria)]
MKICVTAAVTILNSLKKSRRTKYEMDNFLRFDFSKGGKVTIYAEFPKGMQLKGRKLGQWPELSLDIAREKRTFFLAYVSLSDSLWGILGALP